MGGEVELYTLLTSALSIGEWSASSLGHLISPSNRTTLGTVKKREISCPCWESNHYPLVVRPVAWLLYHLRYPAWSVVHHHDLCKNVYSHTVAPVLVTLLVITEILCLAWWQTGKGFKGIVIGFFRAGNVINIITNQQWLAFVRRSDILSLSENVMINVHRQKCAVVCIYNVPWTICTYDYLVP